MIGMLRVASLDEVAVDPTHVGQCVRKALSCGQMLLTVVDDLLDRTRLATGNFCTNLSRVWVIELAEDVLELASHLNRLKLDLHLHVHDSVWQCGSACFYLDPNRTSQVLLNVVTNALKFTPRDGRIDVKIQLVPAAQTLPPTPHSLLALARLPSTPEEATPEEEPPPRLRFEVIDAGIGVPPEQIERCFEPFAKLAQKKLINASVHRNPEHFSSQTSLSGYTEVSQHF